MRIRSTRPEFWRSNTIAQLDWDVRLVLKGLESYVDDNGVGKDDIELIASDVFPRDLFRNAPEVLRRLTEAIATLHEVGLIARYTVESEKLLYVDRWKEIQYIQKPAKGRFPRPDGTMEYADSVNPESYRNPPEDYRTKAGEQWSRRSGEKDLSSELDYIDPIAHITESDYPDMQPIPKPKYTADFEDWWTHYPRKESKGAAFAAWKRACKRATKIELIDGADRYAADPNRHDKFTKLPATWLNGDCWLDEALPSATGTEGIEW